MDAQQVSERVIDVLKDRVGFAVWWCNLDEETQRDISQEIRQAIINSEELKDCTSELRTQVRTLL